MIPQYLKMKDFLSYRSENFNIEELDSPIILIQGINNEGATDGDNNGAGKSALLDAVEWCLYGRIRGEANSSLVKDDVIYILGDNKRAPYARVTYCFLMDDHYYYEVTREKILDGATTLEVKQSLDMSEWVNLTLSPGVNQRTGKRESAISRTQQKIDDILNANCDLFINANFFEQMNTNTYANAKDSEKSQLLRQALYLDKWSDYAKNRKNELSKVERERYAIEMKIKSDDIKDYDEVITQHEVNIKNCKSAIEKGSDRVELLKKDRKKQYSVLTEQEKLVALFENISKQYSSVSIQINDVKLKIKELSGNRSILEDRIKRSKTDKKIYIEEKEELTEKIKEINNIIGRLELDETEYMELISDTQMELGDFRGQVKALTESKDTFQADCPIKATTCSRFSEDEHKNKIKKINSGILRCSAKLKSKEKELADLKFKQSEQKRINTIKADSEKKLRDYTGKINTNTVRVDAILEKISDFEYQISEIDRSVEKLEIELANYEDQFKSISEEYRKAKRINVNETREVINRFDKEINDLQKKINDKESELARSEVQITQCIELRDRNITNKREFNRLSDRFHNLQYSVKVLSKDIPHQLIENALPEIEGYAQDFLTFLSNGRINIYMRTQAETNSKDDAGDIIIHDKLHMELEVDGVLKKYALCSGGERTRADIAIHLAYATFIINRSGPKIRTLFLDEVGMALDNTGKRALVDLLHRLVDEFGFRKIFIISQDDNFNTMFDCSITVKKTSEGSTICRN